MLVVDLSHCELPTRKEILMHESGKKDKGGKEQRKKPKLNPKEKKKLKQEKKKNK